MPQLSNNTSGKLVLPDLNNWLNPADKSTSNIEFADDNVGDFKARFPEYCYNFDEFMDIKQQLNTAKTALDPYSINDETRKRFDSYCYKHYPLYKLCNHKGILVQEYDAEIVTNAWLKMVENLTVMDEILCKHDNKNSKYNTFHVAEAPGNFILGMHQVMQTRHPKIQWNWVGSTYKDIHNADSSYLGDQYGIIKNYSNRWIFGCAGNGDITDPNNIRSFPDDIRNKFGDGNLADLITSDVKYVPAGPVDYNKEENINIPVQLGHTLISFRCLKPGGNMLVKHLTLLESSTVSLLYLMSCTFRQVYILKPMASKAANSEVYIWGKHFMDNVSDEQFQRLLEIMQYIRYFNTEAGSPSIFKKADIPAGFLNSLLQINRELTNNQIKAINKLVSDYKCKKYDSNYNQEKICRTWIKENKIYSLKNLPKIIHKTNYVKNKQ